MASVWSNGISIFGLYIRCFGFDYNGGSKLYSVDSASWGEEV